ncbi:MAG TPA: pyruvate dehydrogenase [Candidatus Solibacter sp.]|nr:pyruvate dehydrogenase [Candidatus Solibacter sp.]
MTYRIADELVSRLVEAGVKRIYGLVGDSLNPVTDAVRRNGKLQWIHVRHEETAAFAAGAEAQLTGKLTACAGSCGPGNLHLINGLFDCHRSMAPVLAIASHIPSTEIGTGYFQETHPENLFKECSHYCELIWNPEQMSRALHIAMQSAVGKGGVGVVVLPGDVAAMELPVNDLPRSVLTHRPAVRPCESDIIRLAEVLNTAKRVCLFCGFGCADAHDEVVALAEKLKSPVGCAYRGKPYVAYDNPFEVGMSGLLGYGAAYEAMHECDVLLLLGTNFPYDKFLPTKPLIAQVDIRAEQLGRRSKIDLGLCGDVRETIRALLPMVSTNDDRAFLDKMLSKHRDAVKKLQVYVEHIGQRRPMHPEPVAAILDEIAADDAIFAADTGMCNVWSSRYIQPTKDRRLIGSFMHGSMANALPQAIGAQLAFPDRQIISMSGDGGLSMLMGDLLTVTQYNLPLKIVVFNNSALGMVKLEMEVAGLPDWQTDNKNPNFAKVAEAIGLMAIRIEDPSELRSGLQKGLDYPGPALIDVVTDPNALSMPSHISADQVEGFGVAMMKLVLSGHIDEVVDTIQGNIRQV